MNIFLQTQRLVITVPSLSDFKDQYTLQSDPDTMQYIGSGIRAEDEVRESLKNAILHYEKHGFSLGSVFEKKTGNFIGRSGLIYLGFEDTQPEIEIAYALLKPYWGQGYASELVKVLVDWGFKNLPIGKLVAVINPGNERSRRVLEKSGFHYVKRAQYRIHEVDLYQLIKN